MSVSIIRKADVRKRTSIGYTTLDTLEAEGKFPRRHKITERIVGWSSIEIDDFVDTVLAGESWDQAGMEDRLSAA